MAEKTNQNTDKQADVAPKRSFKHIVRIANVDVPGEKAIRIALTKIKGVGTNFATAICAAAGISRSATTGDLSDAEIVKLNQTVNNPNEAGIPEWMFNRKKDYTTSDSKHLVTGTLAFSKENDIKRLQRIKSLRGLRLAKKLPVRGQRTRSNFRKSKGKVVGVKKKGKK